MSQSLSKIIIHIVYSTKNREPLIRAELKDDLYKYIAVICDKYHSPAIAIGGYNNHIHIALILHKLQMNAIFGIKALLQSNLFCNVKT